VKISKFVVLAVAASLLSASASAQVATGTPWFGSFAGGPDAVNLGNLNVNFTFPLINKPGRGIPFVLAPTVDSSIWYPVTVNGTTSWQPVSGWGWNGLPGGFNGTVTYQTTLIGPLQCGPPVNGNNYYYSYYTMYYQNFVFVDGRGASHPFGGSTNYSYLGSNGCYGGQQPPPPSEPYTSPANDGSGYSIYAAYTGYTSITDKNGIGVNLGASGPVYHEDLNGNYLVCSGTTCTDTLNTTVMSTVGSAQQPPLVITTNTNQVGGSVQYTVGYTTPSNTTLFHIRTKFNCTNINEYAGTAALPTSITLPDGRLYKIFYESTPGTTTGEITGRISAITLPSDLSSGGAQNGTIQYSYSGGGTGVNGIECSDGTTPTLTRATPDGQWTYSRSFSTPVWTTLVTAPAGSDGKHDQTQIAFVPNANAPTDLLEIGRQVYSGNVGGTPLHTTLTCYASSATNCMRSYSGTPPTSISDMSDRVVTEQFPDNTGISSGYIDTYNVAGLLSIHSVYDFGSSGSGQFSACPLSARLTEYEIIADASDLNTGVNFENVERGVQKQYVYTPSGTNCSNTSTVFYMENHFDETGRVSSGAPQLSTGIYPSGTYGNLTTSYRWVSGGNPVESGLSGTTYQTSTFTNFDSGLVDVATAPNGGTTTYVYNGSGGCADAFPTSVTQTTGNSGVTSLATAATWTCSGGVPLTTTDVNSNQTTISYGSDPYWRPTLITNNATGAATSYSYPTSTSNSSKVEMDYGSSSTSTTVTSYDTLGRVILRQVRQSPTSANYDTVTVSYDARSRQSFQSIPYQSTLGVTGSAPGITTAYYATDRVHTVTDGGGGSVTYSYPQNDTVVAKGPAPTGENPKQRSLEYNGAGLLTSVCELTAGTSSWPGGSCSQTNPNTGYVTKYQYNAAGWLISVQQNAQNSSNTQTRSISYDGFGRTLSETIPEWSAGTGSAGTTTYTYDSIASGNCAGSYPGDLIKKTDNAGNVTCFTYDKLHRNLSSQVVAGTYISVTPISNFVYDAATYNQTTAMQNAKGALAEAYTCTSPCTSKLTDVYLSTSPVTSGAAAGGVLSEMWESMPHSSGYFHTQETRFPNGTLASTYVRLGTNNMGIGVPDITYGIDGEGRPYSTTASGTLNLLASVSYNPASLPTTITFGNTSGGSADQDTITLDSNTYRPKQMQSAINPSTNPFTVTDALIWNANGSLQKNSHTDTNDSTKNQTCTYAADDLARIASVNCGTSTWAQTFTYDPFGNINKANNGGATTYAASYSAITNQVSSGISPAPTYDANGNQLTSTPATLTWNAWNVPISVNSTTATYDALGRMVEKVASGASTQYVFLSSGYMLAAFQNTTGLQKGLIQLAGGGTAVYNASGLSFIRHRDWLGSSHLATTWAHAVYAKEAYAPFGEVYNESGTADRSFTGQDQDLVTAPTNSGGGVYDFLFRKYDPSAGRWLSPDPSGWNAVTPESPQSLNRYSYVWNDPMRSIDPDGLSCVTNWVAQADGTLVSVQVDDGDGLGCAAAGVSPSTPQDPTGTNDGTATQVNGGSSCNGNPNCVVVNPPQACDYQCQVAYANTIAQLQAQGRQVVVTPRINQPGSASNNLQQQPEQTQNQPRPLSACDRMVKQGAVITAGGAVVTAWGFAADAGLVTAPAGIAMNTLGTATMLSGGIWAGAGELGNLIGVCQ
jgi:RHS repeat-associated protein